MKSINTDKAALYDIGLRLKAKKTTCDICGKQFDEFDAQENACWDIDVGYGSKYDTYKIRINLCSDCYDKVLDNFIVPNCKINPILEEERRCCGELGPVESARQKRIDSFLGGDTDEKIWRAVRDGKLTDKYLDEIEDGLRKEGYKI